MKSQLVWLAVLAMGASVGQLGAQDDAKQAEQVAEWMQNAREKLGEEDYAGAAAALEKVVKADPDNALGWQLHGFALHSDGKLDAAIKSHEKAATFDQTKGIALYNLACAYSLKKETTKSLAYLEKAIKAEFLQAEYYETDSDLDHIRDEKKFKYWLAVVKNGGKEPEPKQDKDKDKKKVAKKFRAKALIGSWKVTSGQRSGSKIDPSRLPPTITITAKEITIVSGDDNPFKFAYKLDGSQTPVAIDLEITGGPVPGRESSRHSEVGKRQSRVVL